jgi:hypothetical protein
MQFPFSTEDFFNVFKIYNETVFPLQIIFYLVAGYCIYLLFRSINIRNRIIAGILSFFWLWIGIIYHIIFFSSINKAAYFFGVLFIIQAVLFYISGVLSNKLSFGFQKNVFNYVGLLLLFYALIIYPLLGYFLGHKYPYSPTFGLPCPTTIFTFGVLLFVNKKISVWLLIIPLLWSIIGFGAALKLSVYEDTGLIISGVFGFVLLLIANKRYSILSSY